MLFKRQQKETVETIIKFWCNKFPTMSLHKAIDMFGNTCEKYRTCQENDKLTVVADIFIHACNVMRCDFLSGSQAFEVANSCAADLGKSKTKVQVKINWLMYKKRNQK